MKGFKDTEGVVNWSETLLFNRMVTDTQIAIEKKAWLEDFFQQGVGSSVDHTFVEILYSLTTPSDEQTER